MNILIIRFSALGDLVTLEPVFRSIRYFYSTASVTFITSLIGEGLYRDSGYIDQFIVYKNIKDVKDKIKNQVFDIVFNLHCNSLSHKLVFFTYHKKVVNISANWIQKLFNIKVKARDIKVLMNLSGVNKQEIDNYFKTDSAKVVQLPYVLDNSLSESKNKHVAISTGSSEKWLSKQWGVKNYKELIKLLRKSDIEVILIGTKLELEDSKFIISEIEDINNLVDKTDLRQLKNILGNIDLYIGNDSGPTHIAAATGTSTLTIFCSTDIQHSPKFGNYSGKHFFIRPSKTIQCYPCYKQICPTNMECTDDIKVQKVYNKVMEILNG